VKGQYKAGKENKIVQIGTQLTVAHDTYQVGWSKLVDGRFEDSVMGYVVEGYQRPDRQELGDNDRATWPGGKDPWLKMARVVAYQTKGREDTLYTFSTLSIGGLSALGKLFEQAGMLMRMHPGSYPIVTLKTGSYRNTTHNTDVDFPVFELTGWDNDPWVGAAVRKEAA
jgi:hypothetical protein